MGKLNDKKVYVKPIHTKNDTNKITLKRIYANLHPHYWKRKLPHLLIVVPIIWFIYQLIFLGIFTNLLAGQVAPRFLETISMFFSLSLTLIGAIFYPYSLYWYKKSLIGQILNNIIYFGGFWSVIFKVILTLIGGIVIAGILSPVVGILVWRKYKNRNEIIGEEIDFS